MVVYNATCTMKSYGFYRSPWPYLRATRMPGRQTSRLVQPTCYLMSAILGRKLLASATGFVCDPKYPGDRATTAKGQMRLVSLSQDAQPSLEGGLGWINSGPIDLAQLKGKIVLLDFWTY